MSASVIFDVFDGVGLVFIDFMFDLDFCCCNNDAVEQSLKQGPFSGTAGVEDADTLFLCLGAMVCSVVYLISVLGYGVAIHSGY
jgi:hypothetical protein